MRRIIERDKFISRMTPDVGITVTVSIGVAVSGPDAAQDQHPTALISTLRQQADIALYSAKSAGRNTVTVAPAQLQSHA
jgi:GGDEF domain-containing protein